MRAVVSVPYIQKEIKMAPMKKSESYHSGRYSLASSTLLGPINCFQCPKPFSLTKTRASDGPLLEKKKKVNETMVCS